MTRVKRTPVVKDDAVKINLDDIESTDEDNIVQQKYDYEELESLDDVDIDLTEDSSDDDTSPFGEELTLEDI